MPFLDVSSVLLDPMFLTRGLACIRTTQTVSDQGHAVNTSSTTTFAGVVTNNSGDTLQRSPSGSRIEGDIMIHTKFQLTDGKDGREADQVKYKGNLYTVVNVADWSDYGRGFCAATCNLTPLSGGK